MGGMVNVAFRFPDGRVETRRRPTGSLKPWLHDMRTLAGDREFLDGYLRWEGSDGKPTPTPPEGYGLVVVDYVSGRIMSMQDYTSFGRYAAVTLNQELGQLLDKEDPYPEPELGEEMARWTGLLGEGRISAEATDRLTGEVSRRPVTAAHPAELLRVAEDAWARREAARTVFFVDLSPLVVEDFRDPALGGLRKMRDLMAERGFVFSDEARAAWDDALSISDKQSPDGVAS